MSAQRTSSNQSENAAVPELREARPDDAAAVAGVHVRSWQAAYRGLLPDEYLDGLRAENRARRYTFHLVGPEHPATTVALAAGRLCGFVTTGPARGGAETNQGEIYALYVDPDAWGPVWDERCSGTPEPGWPTAGSPTRFHGF